MAFDYNDKRPIAYAPPTRGVVIEIDCLDPVRIPRSTLARLGLMAREQGHDDPIAVAIDILCEDDSDPRSAIHKAACRWAAERGLGCVALVAGEWTPRPSAPEPWRPAEWTPTPPQPVPEPEAEVTT